MNSHNTSQYRFDLDRRIHTALGRWAERQIPPLQVRRELMHTVRQEAISQGHNFLRQPSDGFVETVYLGPVITFNHCFGIVFSLHTRVRL